MHPVVAVVELVNCIALVRRVGFLVLRVVIVPRVVSVEGLVNWI